MSKELVLSAQCRPGGPRGACQPARSFEVYTAGEADSLRDALKIELRNELDQLHAELAEARRLIKQQKQTIEALSAALTRQMSSLPTEVAADAQLVGLLREQLQVEFDDRYQAKSTP